MWREDNSANPEETYLEKQKTTNMVDLFISNKMHMEKYQRDKEISTKIHGF